MRIRLARGLTTVAVALNVVALYFIWLLLIGQEGGGNGQGQSDVPSSVALAARRGESEEDERRRPSNDNSNNNVKDDRHYEDDAIVNNVTIVIRAFEHFDNDIANTVRSIASTYPGVRIIIVSETVPYPPLPLVNATVSNNGESPLLRNVIFVSLAPALDNPFDSRSPLLQIRTPYVLFMPDSSRIHTKRTLARMVKVIMRSSRQHEQVGIVAATFKAAPPIACLRTEISAREWTLRFQSIPMLDASVISTGADGDGRRRYVCDTVRGKHAALIRTALLHSMTDPFMSPFPDALYIQASSLGIKTQVMYELPFGNGKELYNGPHNQWKVQRLEKERAQTMYRHLGIKKVIRESGNVELYGCRRDTSRCFGTVIDDTPSYLWQGKWTPPCCLAGLRQTARHVFQVLESSGVRYWLEGGSLLGAIRSSDILPWDYDVDLGIYREDINRVDWLVKAKTKPVSDDHGFVWEKASEGDFFRVHFSHVNRLHVDIFPFYSRNGTMTKNTWFKTHRQDMEFPEHFLKPMSSIDFVGRTVSTPNNIHDFLELKFGEGAVESPSYPNPLKMASLGHKTVPDRS